MTDVSEASGGVLVIGAGIAGLWTALSMAPHPVTVITAGRIGDGSSSWAQGGMAAAIGEGDSADLHVIDTLAAGAGLARPSVAHFLCSNGPAAVRALHEAGVPFDTDSDGRFRLGREAAHGRERIVHVGGDEAGAAIMRTLADRAREASHITIREELVAEHVLTSDDGVAGAMTWDIRRARTELIHAGAIVIATGGIGGLYEVTTNPLSSQGHGLTLAAEAGATLRDLEFVQFHPTALHVGCDPAPLATEAIRGDGGLLRDADGVRFMLGAHRDAELAPRDIVARGVAHAIQTTGAAFLDVRGSLGRTFSTRFPTVAEACREAGIDPETDLLPIAPAVHYHMGGIRTNVRGETDVNGLFAVGECASTGVHGANRLASNSLLEAIVFGGSAAAALKTGDWAPHRTRAQALAQAHRPAQDLGALRHRMARSAGILRDKVSLQDALDATEHDAASTVGGRLARIAARMVLASALFREESRGAHQRTDFPDTATSPRHTLLRMSGGEMALSAEDMSA